MGSDGAWLAVLALSLAPRTFSLLLFWQSLGEANVVHGLYGWVFAQERSAHVGGFLVLGLRWGNRLFG